MKLNTICHQCSAENYYQTLDIIIKDDGLYELTCEAGHKSLIYLTNAKFEILFDIGIRALIDGYTREAVATIAASLERFYEFYNKVIQAKRGVSSEDTESSWKQVTNNSERQIGAFVYVYLIENKKAVTLIENDNMKNGKSVQNFRNAVIHKGKIPTKDEVMEYGEKVLSFISEILNELKTKNDTYVKELIKSETEQNLNDRKEETSAYAMQITTIFISNAPLEYSLAPTTFEKAVELVSNLNIIKREVG